VILSCDKYSDIWNPVVTNIKSNLPKCRYPLYLVTNEREFIYPGVINVKTGPDADWSTSLKIALSEIPERELLILLDDMPLHESPTLERIDEAFSLLSLHNLGTLHPRPVPPIRRWNKDHQTWFEYSHKDSYTCNVFAIWKKEVLEQILVEGESPWEFEMLGSERLNTIARSGALKTNLLNYANLVIKGMWDPKVAKLEFDLRLGLDLSKRKIISKFSIKRILADSLFRIVQKYLPRKLQRILFTLFRKIG
jgi:hypothetical protein